MSENNFKTRFIVAVALIVVLAGIGGVLSAQRADEPTIRVRNGSMDVTLEGGTWVDNGGDGWSPSTGVSAGTFFVKVVPGANKTCESPGTTADGKAITISYSDKTDVTIQLVGPPTALRTKVRPKDKLVANGARLRYSQAGDAGFISRIQVRGQGPQWSCSFGSRAELSEIRICSAPNTVCQ